MPLNHAILPLLFAQDAPLAEVHVGGGIDNPPVALMMLLGVLALLIPLTAIIAGIWHAARERELEHTERMKARELGLMLPKDAPSAFWTASKLSACRALGLPLISLLVALVASLNEPDLGYYAWVSAGLVSIAGIAAGTTVMLGANVATHASNEPRSLKPAMTDPDALDTTARRSWNDSISQGYQAANP
jgi:hypothetical protein